jgi:DNA excision repair protein ERCC-2
MLSFPDVDLSTEKISERISVTDIATLFGRSGDLKRRDFSLLRGTEGIRLHRKLQADRGERFQAEVPVRSRWKHLQIDGRVDGVDRQDGVVLEEYKTTLNPVRDAESPSSIHMLQLQLYGWLWEREHAETPSLRLIYASPRGDQHPVPLRPHPDPESLLDAVITYKQEQRDWITERNAALRQLAFPYETLRPGQTELMEAVSETFTRGGRLIAEAPTGIGKTLAVLLPALKAMGEGEVDSLYVATCRNAGKNTIEDALRHLSESLPGLRAITLQAKERICRETGSPCDCEICPLARGFYDRLPEAMKALRQEKLWDVGTWSRVAREHEVCPFAFSMSAAREADVLVGDINYALDPTARLEFFFGRPDQRPGLIVDEAHHLPDRVRGMCSAVLNSSELRRHLRELPSAHRPLIQKGVNRVNREIRTFVAEQVEQNGWPKDHAEPPNRVAFACGSALEVLELSLAESAVTGRDARPELFQSLAAFRSAVHHAGSSHVAFTENGALHWFCRDPGEWIRDHLEEVEASVFFSATLSPISSYRRVVGLGAETSELVLPSPFPPEHLSVTTDTSLDLSYRNRSPETLSRLSEQIAALLSEHRKNTIVFFPSYAFMQEVASRMPPADLVMGPVRLQPRGLQEEEAREFLQPFFDSEHAGAVFAVLGGALNEGIDLPGAACVRVIVVSIGLPAVCIEREILRDHFSRAGEDGFYMAYGLPGITRIRQAMGRVIRGPEDRGEVILIDARFRRPLYENFFS